MSAPCVRSVARDCDGVDPMPVKRFMHREPVVYCAHCRESLTAAGVSYVVIERRAIPRDQPVWLRRMTARVLDHGVTG